MSAFNFLMQMSNEHAALYQRVKNAIHSKGYATLYRQETQLPLTLHLFKQVRQGGGHQYRIIFALNSKTLLFNEKEQRIVIGRTYLDDPFKVFHQKICKSAFSFVGPHIQEWVLLKTGKESRHCVRDVAYWDYRISSEIRQETGITSICEALFVPHTVLRPRATGYHGSRYSSEDPLSCSTYPFFPHNMTREMRLSLLVELLLGMWAIHASGYDHFDLCPSELGEKAPHKGALHNVIIKQVACSDPSVRHLRRDTARSRLLARMYDTLYANRDDSILSKFSDSDFAALYRADNVFINENTSPKTLYVHLEGEWRGPITYHWESVFCDVIYHCFSQPVPSYPYDYRIKIIDFDLDGNCMKKPGSVSSQKQVKQVLHYYASILLGGGLINEYLSLSQEEELDWTLIPEENIFILQACDFLNQLDQCNDYKGIFRALSTCFGSTAKSVLEQPRLKQQQASLQKAIRQSGVQRRFDQPLDINTVLAVARRQDQSVLLDKTAAVVVRSYLKAGIIKNGITHDGEAVARCLFPLSTVVNTWMNPDDKPAKIDSLLAFFKAAKHYFVPQIAIYYAPSRLPRKHLTAYFLKEIQSMYAAFLADQYTTDTLRTAITALENRVCRLVKASDWQRHIHTIMRYKQPVRRGLGCFLLVSLLGGIAWSLYAYCALQRTVIAALLSQPITMTWIICVGFGLILSGIHYACTRYKVPVTVTRLSPPLSLAHDAGLATAQQPPTRVLADTCTDLASETTVGWETPLGVVLT